ncbi:MAG: hypothetical protein KF729_26220 [Sandaracinaceae bacterium]|nr:hypothetical protein [Sandaracinaceae bacterium]
MGADDTRASRPIWPWLLATAAVYLGGSFLPVPGVDHEALASLSAGGGLLALFDQPAVVVPLVGFSASTLVLLHVLLVAGGLTERAAPRRVAFLVYLVISLGHAFVIALWLESFGVDTGLEVVPRPGWAFRLAVIAGLGGGAALLWWAFGRIDRTGRAHGAFWLAILLTLGRALDEAGRAGARAASGDIVPALALVELALPLALLVVALALAVRPVRWPAKVFGVFALRSGWDAVALPAVALVPVATYALGALVPGNASLGSATVRVIAAVVPLGVAIAVVVALRGAPRADAARPLGPALVAGAGLVASALALVVSFAGAGGIEAALTPGPLEGTHAYRLVLEAEDRFAEGDAAAMVRRLEALGARARIEAASATRVTLALEDAAELEHVIEALTPHRLELRFAREHDPALFEGLTPMLAHDGRRQGAFGWSGDCERVAEHLESPPSDCDAVVQPGRPEGDAYERECRVHCAEDELVLGGDGISEARVAIDPTYHAPTVALELTAEAAARFGDATAANVGRALLILVDDEVVSAPIVRSRIDGGRVVITLGASAPHAVLLRDASALAEALRPNGRIRSRFVVADAH